MQLLHLIEKWHCQHYLDTDAGWLTNNSHRAYITHQLMPIKENWSRVAKQATEWPQRSPLGHRKRAAIPHPQWAPLGAVMAQDGVVAGRNGGEISEISRQLQGEGGGSRNWKPEFLKIWRFDYPITGGEYAKAKAGPDTLLPFILAENGYSNN